MAGFAARRRGTRPHKRHVHFTRARGSLNFIWNYSTFIYLVRVAIKKDRLRFDP